MRILIVDDSQAMRRIERDVLSEIDDLEIVEAEDGVRAIYKMRELGFQIDLILTDWVMPNMDGLALVKRLKSSPNLNRIPILMVTSVSDEARMSQAWSAGVDGYILKPFTREIFLQSLFSLTSGAVGCEEGTIDWEDAKAVGKSFLQELPLEMRNRIVDMSAVLDVEPGSKVLREGDVLGYFYFVVEGVIEERPSGSASAGGAPRAYGPGDCFGVTELMAGDPLRSDFLATAPARIGRLPQVVFEGMLEKFPKIGITLSRCLAARARQLEVQGRDETSDVSGKLEILDLPTLVQAISLRQKTCAIELPELEAEIVFVSGNVYSVRNPDCEGEEAFGRILAMNPTNFKIVVKPLEGERNVHIGTMNLLLRWATEMDEAQGPAATGSE